MSKPRVRITSAADLSPIATVVADLDGLMAGGLAVGDRGPFADGWLVQEFGHLEDQETVAVVSGELFGFRT